MGVTGYWFRYRLEVGQEAPLDVCVIAETQDAAEKLVMRELRPSSYWWMTEAPIIVDSEMCEQLQEG